MCGGGKVKSKWLQNRTDRSLGPGSRQQSSIGSESRWRRRVGIVRPLIIIWIRGINAQLIAIKQGQGLTKKNALRRQRSSQCWFAAEASEFILCTCDRTVSACLQARLTAKRSPPSHYYLQRSDYCFTTYVQNKTSFYCQTCCLHAPWQRQCARFNRKEMLYLGCCCVCVEFFMVTQECGDFDEYSLVHIQWIQKEKKSCRKFSHPTHTHGGQRSSWLSSPLQTGRNYCQVRRGSGFERPGRILRLIKHLWPRGQQTGSDVRERMQEQTWKSRTWWSAVVSFPLRMTS